MAQDHKLDTTSNKYKLPPGLSMYLDLLRFLAAFAVYIFHAGYFGQFKIPFFGDFGSHGVVAFFVLSGLVIAYSSDTKHTDIIDFFLVRLARLWSVVFPALALTFILDIIGQHIAMAAYAPMQSYTAMKWITSIFMNALFINQIWNFHIWPGTNGPFWSLSYEFWYYAIFAGMFYFRGIKRLAVVGAMMAVAGPGIIIALPVWGLGVALYGLLKTGRLPGLMAGLIIWGLSFALALFYALIDGYNLLLKIVPVSSSFIQKDLSINFWPESYLIGIIISLNIYGFAAIAMHCSNQINKKMHLVRLIADTSFGLYLFHYPVMYFCKALLSAIGITGGRILTLAIYFIPFVVSVLLSLKCETYKRRLLAALRTASAKFGYRRNIRVDNSASMGNYPPLNIPPQS